MTAKFRKTILFSLLFTYLSMSCVYSQSSTMFLYETKKGYTYVDKDFNPLMNKTFKWAGRFFDGLAVASENGYVGYINTKGDFVIKPEFEYALPFHHGVAKVWKDGKVYLINQKGKIFFDHNYLFIKYAVRDSFEPFFLVTTYGFPRKMGVIDKNGKLLVDTIYNNIQPFCEGLAVIQKGNETGVVNLQGKIIVPFGKYSQIGNFNSSRANVVSSEWEENTVGAIDKLGNLVFKEADCKGSDWNCNGWDYSYWRKSYRPSSSFYYEFAFSDGLAILNKTDESKKLINLNGKTIYEGNGDIKLLGEGFAMVMTKTQEESVTTSSSAVFDSKGNLILQNPSTVIEKAVKIANGNVYFTNHKGEMINLQGVVVSGVKPQNIFLTPYHTEEHEYFLHNDLIIKGEKPSMHMRDAIWAYDWRNRDKGFLYLDTDGFKQGLLYAIFNESNFSCLIWGYLNAKGEIVYQNKTKADFEQGVKLNLNYKEDQGFLTDTDETKNDLEYSANPNKITILLDPLVSEKAYHFFPSKRLYHSLKIINETQDTINIPWNIRDQTAIQAKDKNGIWREILTSTPSNIIYDGTLAPNKFWDFYIPSYSGGFKTKMRVIVKIPNIQELVSNEIDCEINASQFVRDKFQKARFEIYPFEDYEFDRF